MQLDLLKWCMKEKPGKIPLSLNVGHKQISFGIKQLLAYIGGSEKQGYVFVVPFSFSMLEVQVSWVFTSVTLKHIVLV